METIIRGTNAAILITIKDEIDFSTITTLELHIYQAGLSIVKTKDELILDGENRTIAYKLTQEESLSLTSGRDAEITIIGIADGNRFEARPVIKVSVENTRKNEVME